MKEIVIDKIKKKDILIELIKEDPYSLSRASDELKNDKQLILFAIEKCPEDAKKIFKKCDLDLDLYVELKPDIDKLLKKYKKHSNIIETKDIQNIEKNEEDIQKNNTEENKNNDETITPLSNEEDERQKVLKRIREKQKTLINKEEEFKKCLDAKDKEER